MYDAVAHHNEQYGRHQPILLVHLKDDLLQGLGTILSEKAKAINSKALETMQVVCDPSPMLIFSPIALSTYIQDWHIPPLTPPLAAALLQKVSTKRPEQEEKEEKGKKKRPKITDFFFTK